MLAPVSQGTLECRFVQELKSAVRELRKASDPISKELRTYTVQPSESLVREIASCLIHVSHPMSLTLKSQYPHDCSSRNWCRFRSDQDKVVPSSSAQAAYMAYLYTLVEPCLDHVRYFKFQMVATLSLKTQVRATPLRAVILEKIDQCSALTPGVVPTLEGLLPLMAPELWSNLFPTGGCEVTLEHPFILQLLDVVLNWRDRGASTIQEIMVSWNRQVSNINLLTMRVKTYINRADTRAYYVDKLEVRHLCGAIYQSVFQARSRSLRRRQPFEEYMPTYNKNLIDVHIKLEGELHVMVLFGDISSFTNSCVNCWVLALATLSSLLTHDHVGHLRHPFLVLIHGRYITATLELVILVFLFTTVGVPAQTDVGPHVAPGGYLGVKSNIVTTLVFFCILLTEIVTKCKTLYPVVSTRFVRVGGDDFLIVLTSPDPSMLYEVRRYFQDYITREVGRLKEFECDVYSTMVPGSYTSTGVFCKKLLSVTITRRANYDYDLYIQSQQKLPLMGELMEDFTHLSEAERRLRLYRFSHSVWRLLDGYDGQLRFWRAYTYAFMRLHQLPLRLLEVQRRVFVHPASLVEVDGVLLTPNAYAASFSVEGQVTRGGIRCSSTVRGKLRLLVADKVVTIQRAHNAVSPQEVLSVYLHATDRHMTYTRKVGELPYDMDGETGDWGFVYTAVVEAREQLSFLYVTS